MNAIHLPMRRKIGTIFDAQRGASGVMEKRGLNSNQLKLIAIIAMTIDHFTWAVFPGTQTVWYVMGLHVIGRITAPIMWFFIAEGSFYTRNVKKYIGRLLVFAVISHFAYDFAFGIPFFDISAGVFNRTSVMWALAISAAVIAISKSEKVPKWAKIVSVFAGCILAFPADWSSIAVMAPFSIYGHRGSFKKQALDIVFWTFIYAAVYFIFLNKPYAVLQMFTALSIPLLYQYNGRRGTWKGMKWFFYIYYPAHLFAVGIVRLLLHGNIGIIFS